MDKEKTIDFGFKIMDILMKDFSALGGLVFYVLITGLFFLMGMYKEAIFLILSFAGLATATIIIRSMYFKPRPFAMEYNSFIEKIDASSFPSVHSARIMALYLCLLFYFGTGILANVFLGGIVLFVLISRVYLKKHFLVDVVGGAMVGFISSMATYIILLAINL